jgi:hypothetical protein
MENRMKHTEDPLQPASPSPQLRRVNSLAIRRAKALILVAAGLSLLLSVGLWFGGQRDQGLFVGIWVPSILSLGSLLLQGVHSSE